MSAPPPGDTGVTLRAGRVCRVCLADDCVVPAWPELPAWQWVGAGGALWVNVPASGNWNWYNPDIAGSSCWEDLLHMNPPPTRSEPPADVRWVCDECLYAFPGFPGSIAAGTYEYAYPASAPPCPGCGDEHCWPLPRTARTPPPAGLAVREAAVRAIAAGLSIPAEMLGVEPREGECTR